MSLIERLEAAVKGPASPYTPRLIMHLAFLRSLTKETK